jgi:pentatricopeptide repeat protein
MFTEARELFEDMPEKNVVGCTAMITGYCKEGDVESARRLFDGIRIKDVISWNAMISGNLYRLESFLMLPFC